MKKLRVKKSSKESVLVKKGAYVSDGYPLLVIPAVVWLRVCLMPTFSLVITDQVPFSRAYWLRSS